MSLLKRRLKKLVRSPYRFFRDPIRRRLLPSETATPAPKAVSTEPQLIPTFAFHINDWKQPVLMTWFPERLFYFVPIKADKQVLKSIWIPRMKQTPGAEIFVWGVNLPAPVREMQLKKTYVEDGFIRSLGLGSTRTPPISLNMDSRTPYFNARKASDLEVLLANFNFDADTDLLTRAARLMSTLRESGLSKYNHSEPVDIAGLYGPKSAKRVLVIGQVEDDASILYGCRHAHTNNDLVYIARLENPDAQVIYKPHPDVLHRRRAKLSNPDDVRHIATVLDQDVPLAQSFHSIDHVYTITSQAGFEALIHGLPVTTLGCPFYSGWGVTDDREPNPRRQRKLSVTEIFAVAYLLYPRYFDPLYKRPMSAEEAVARLIALRALQPAPPCVLPATDASAVVESKPNVATMAAPAYASYLVEEIVRASSELRKVTASAAAASTPNL